MADIFISYSTKDHADAEFLQRILESRLLSCWMAPLDIQPGEHYATKIPAAILDAKFFLVLVSENSRDSNHVGNEVNLAVSRKKPIIAVHLDKTPFSDALEYHLALKRQFDVNNGLSSTADEIVTWVHEEITRQTLAQQQKIDRPDPRSVAPLAWPLMMGVLGIILITICILCLYAGCISPYVFLWTCVTILVLTLLGAFLIRTPLFRENAPLFRFSLKVVEFIQTLKF